MLSTGDSVPQDEKLTWAEEDESIEGAIRRSVFIAFHNGGTESPGGQRFGPPIGNYEGCWRMIQKRALSKTESPAKPATK